MLSKEEKKTINKGLDVIRAAIKRGDKEDVMEMLLPLAAEMDKAPDRNYSPELELEYTPHRGKDTGPVGFKGDDNEEYFSEQYIPSLSSKGLDSFRL